ncbi:MAG: phosphatase PAP2 family protein [Candidatus Eremiobacteraeota bacterium]|nr:phosphatase PAP2 family protein [Candidatus Eremiobacteraeota bacterium]
MKEPLYRRLLLISGSFLVFCLLYYGSAYLGDSFQHRYRLYFDWERNIPLVPEAAFVYMSATLMFLPIFRKLPTAAQLWPLSLTLAAEQLLAGICFYLLPLEDGFPTGPVPTGLSGAMWRLAGTVAMRHNYLPSLHVALATTAAMVYARAVGRPSWPMNVWAAAIALSTLLIHQHHVADVIAGFLLAQLGVRLLYDRLAAQPVV